MKTTFILKNLTCEACSKVSRMKIQKIPGIEEVTLSQHGSVAYGVIEAPRAIALSEIEDALTGTAYTVAAI